MLEESLIVGRLVRQSSYSIDVTDLAVSRRRDVGSLRKATLLAYLRL